MTTTPCRRATAATSVITPTVHYFGSAVALLSTSNDDGTTNLTPISSAWSLEDHYVLGMIGDGRGAQNLERTGEVVVNLPDAALAGAVERIAPTTGATPVPDAKRSRYRHEPDKWGLAGLTPAGSDLVGPDRVRECPVQIEAELAAVHRLAPLLAAYDVRVVRVHARSDLVLPGTSYVDLDAWTPLYYTFRHHYAQGAEVGVSFKAEQ